MTWEYPHDFVSDGGEWCAVCGASCIGHGTKKGDEAALARIVAKRQTPLDTSAQERARFFYANLPDAISTALQVAQEVGAPDNLQTVLYEWWCAQVAEAKRRGAEEMRERAVVVADTEPEPQVDELVELRRGLLRKDAEAMTAVAAGAVRATKKCIANRIRALSPDGGENG